jgi:hypothetical protein
MNARFISLVISLAAVTLSGCATIVHGGPRTIPVESTPPGATVWIYDRNNDLVSKQTTPFVVTLPIKYRYFKGQNYRLVFDMAGYEPAESNLASKVSGWYFGNILFGGLAGLLIVDPLTGAMYDLKPEKVEQTLTAAQTQTAENGDP